MATDPKLNKALHSAVAAIYFNDSSDYEGALWDIVRALAPELIDELETDPAEVYAKTLARRDGILVAENGG